MRSIKKYLLVIVFCIGIKAEYAPNLLSNSDLDFLVIRLSTVYGIKIPDGFYSRPLNLSSLDNFFCKADSLDSSGLLSPYERSLLKQAEIYTGFQRSKFKYSNENRDIHLKINLDLVGDSRFKQTDSTISQLKGIISPSLSGNVGKLSFYSGIDVWTEYRSDTLFKGSSYQPYDGLSYNVYGRNTESTHFRASDVPRGGVYYDAGRIKLETAIDYLKYGPAIYYPLTLSGMTPPITYARASLDMGIMHYSHIIGQLKSQKDKSKYIYTHRLDCELWKSRLQIGVNEVIINGSTTNQDLGDTNRINPDDTGQIRDWEWVYMIPFVPFKFVEHYSGDRDNAAISFDVNVNLSQRLRWYGEFFLDDMLNPLEIFSDDWGNKWAATIGMQYFRTFFSRDITFTTEYSHVEPWVYTHFYGGSHSYTHFGQCLGSPLGPNSQAIMVSSLMQLTKTNSIEINFSNIAKNSSARGGDIIDVFQDPQDSTLFHDSEKKKFLGPGTVWTSKPAIRWYFNPFGKLSVNMEYALIYSDKNLTNSISAWGCLRF